MTLVDHKDYQHLEKVLEDLEKMAENINELKKRKELVDKYVDGKGPHNVMHGLTKKITRTTQQVSFNF
jgi:tetrahydromethanopterin S-methyltransferase subunit G